MQSKTGRIGRRAFLGGLSTTVLAAPYISRYARAQDAKRIILPTYGGAYQEILQTAFTRPFTEETGIEVLFSGVPDLARLKAQVQSGQPEWDVFEAGGSWFPAGSKEGLFEKLDDSVIDSNLIVGNGDYATFYLPPAGIAWHGDRHTAETAPRDWQQFWDTEKFPGRRTLRNRADYVLEIALVADGVAPDQLYPLDVDRAFASLEKIKPAVAKWAESTSQLTTLLSTNEVDFAYNYNGRVKAAQNSGTNLQISMEQAFLANEYIGVVKGTPRKEAAMQFVAFVLRPDRQADFANLSAYVPGNPAAIELMTPEARQWLPKEGGAHIRQNDEWWAARSEEVQQRFQLFLLN